MYIYLLDQNMINSIDNLSIFRSWNFVAEENKEIRTNRKKKKKFTMEMG